MAAGGGPVIGEQIYQSGGTYTWTCPGGVTSVSVVAVGPGQSSGDYVGGQGGELRYRNDISVTPGNNYTVVVGQSSPSSLGIGTSSSFDGATLSANSGGGGSGSGGTGYQGGFGGSRLNQYTGGGGGGGAGGYTGNGGNGGNGGYYAAGTPGSSGVGGGGGGGGGGSGPSGGVGNGGGGGSVGLRGLGLNGLGGAAGSIHGNNGSSGRAGSDGDDWYGMAVSHPSNPGGAPGGISIGQGGATGAVRIIWPGTTRQFPSTNTGTI